ncbi:MAG: dolichyl-phosphate-mannose--protein O-mannosyl transferase [Chthoniobacteraceae bacterium]|nr:dolichyl-phosphate-mannose--protein O-mannosyl transferase [Chthoniobacteraceae bacterium]
MNLLSHTLWPRFLAALIGLALTNHSVLAQESVKSDNLLTNGSFEKGIEGWTLNAHEKIGQVAIDEKEKHGSKPSLRLENPSGDDTFLKQTVTVKPNTKYRLSGYIKTKDVQTVKREGKDGASLSVGGGFVKTPPIVKSKSWTKVTHEFATGAETEIEVGPRLGFFSALTTGTAWFADLSLDELGRTTTRR